MSLLNLLRQPRPAKNRRFALRVEALESRCLLSLAPASDFVLPSESLLPILPEYGREPSSIVDLLPVPSDSKPWPDQLPPANYPPTEAPPDWSDQGGPIDLGDFNSPQQPEVMGKPLSSGEAGEVAALLAALTYVPRADAAGHEAAVDAHLATLDPVPRQAGVALSQRAEGGLVAVTRAPLAEVESPETVAADLDAWLSTPVQMEGQRGRFQAFEIATSEPRTQPTSFVRDHAGSDHAMGTSVVPTSGELPTTELPNTEVPAGEEALPPGDGALPGNGQPADGELTDAENSIRQPMAAPVSIDEQASLSLNAVAGLAFVYFSRVMRRTSSRQPGEAAKTPLVSRDNPLPLH